MDKLAESLYEAHQNPIVKLYITGKANKIYLPKNTEEEKSLVSSNIETLKRAIDFPRVDRRCNRSFAVWLDDKHLAKVIKRHYQSYGFQDKTGNYLFPEEALFLLETNKLEIQWKDIPISIEQAYSLIINNDILSLDKYKMYKKLAIQGYRISKPNKLFHDNLEPKRKKIKLTPDDDTKVSTMSNQNCNSEIKEVKGTDDSNSLQNYDYRICNAKTKGSYNVYIIENTELDPKICQLENGDKNLYGISTPDSVAFYKFCKVNIPDLSNDDLS